MSNSLSLFQESPDDDIPIKHHIKRSTENQLRWRRRLGEDAAAETAERGGRGVLGSGVGAGGGVGVGAGQSSRPSVPRAIDARNAATAWDEVDPVGTREGVVGGNASTRGGQGQPGSRATGGRGEQPIGRDAINMSPVRGFSSTSDEFETISDDACDGGGVSDDDRRSPVSARSGRRVEVARRGGGGGGGSGASIISVRAVNVAPGTLP